MGLQVETPDPPELSTVDPSTYEDATVVAEDDGTPDYRREELSEFLEDGAWQRAFEEWADYTDVEEPEFAIIEDLGLIEEFDFFWDDFADRVGYHAPGIPEDWRERDLHPDLDTWNSVSSINAGLTELGQTVSELLKQEYVDWEADYDAPDDLPDF